MRTGPRGTEALIASWSALVRVSGGATERRPSYAAARCPHPVFNNALLLTPDGDAIPAITRFYAEHATPFALWTWDSHTSEIASGAGMVRDGGTTDMARTLADLPPLPDEQAIVGCLPETVAEINGLPGELVRGVVGFDAFTTVGGAAGLMTFRHHDDVQLSFVATKPEHRQRGLATGLVIAALHVARRRGATTATLQATPDAVPLYRRLGFKVTGEWLEWVRPSAT